MPWTIERKHDHVAVVTMNTNKVNAQNPVFFADLSRFTVPLICASSPILGRPWRRSTAMPMPAG
jgi:hypothetical protein